MVASGPLVNSSHHQQPVPDHRPTDQLITDHAHLGSSIFVQDRFHDPVFTTLR
jgi:hypothetical protein